MKRNNQPAVPKAKKAKKKAVKGFVWDEWGKDAAQLSGKVYLGEHKGEKIGSIFLHLDLPYNKYSEGNWNRHYNDIKKVYTAVQNRSDGSREQDILQACVSYCSQPVVAKDS
jgi:hypothetical protein